MGDIQRGVCIILWDQRIRAHVHDRRRPRKDKPPEGYASGTGYQDIGILNVEQYVRACQNNLINSINYCNNLFGML